MSKYGYHCTDGGGSFGKLVPNRKVDADRIGGMNEYKRFMALKADAKTIFQYSHDNLKIPFKYFSFDTKSELATAYVRRNHFRKEHLDELEKAFGSRAA